MPRTYPVDERPHLVLNRVPQPTFGPANLPPHYVEHLRRIGVPEPQWQRFVSDLRAIVCSVLDAERTTLPRPYDP